MSKRILVVEDHAYNRQIIRDMLGPPDYEITEAESGEEALAAIAKQRPDLILMDIGTFARHLQIASLTGIRCGGESTCSTGSAAATHQRG